MKMHGRLALAALLLTSTLTVASCGGSGDENMGHERMNGGGGSDRSMNHDGMDGMSSGMMKDDTYSDEAFIDAMVPHHRDAVEMAEVALENAEHQEIQRLARNIIFSQRAEIEEMRSLKGEMSGASDVPRRMSEKDMEGMDMMPSPSELANREPFDEAFMDAMIPHHQSAIEMARTAGRESGNPEIQTLADDIIAAQKKEIEQMKTWRKEWYPEG